ncbi:MAG: 2-hydroxychromene-2-carboxylate isomerase [Gammaproteobacteria bacterium]|nr:2-hydroxychromene-2-carboxylate isomerase [Gammaproteobacteria bacterium]
MKEVAWYFDFISPFAYMAMEQRHRLPQDTKTKFIPVLFAGLLNHWEHKGPAEIPAKRRFTYRHAHWLANKQGIPLKIPPAHPFNPIAVLRLSIALDNDADAIEKIFRFIWRDGRRVDDAQGWHDLTRTLGLSDADARVSTLRVKQELRRNGDKALARGVFGVPSFIADDELFWGIDALDFLVDYLNDPSVLDNDEMRRISDLPIGRERRR